MQADSSVPSVSEGSRRSRLSAAGSRSPDIALRTIAVWRTLELALIPPPNPLQGLDTQGPDQDPGARKVLAGPELALSGAPQQLDELPERDRLLLPGLHVLQLPLPAPDLLAAED